MSEPKRLLDGSSSGLARTLLGSASVDVPSEAARQAASSVLGIGSGIAGGSAGGALGGASSALPGAASANSAVVLAGGAAKLSGAAIASWLTIGLIATAAVVATIDATGLGRRAAIERAGGVAAHAGEVTVAKSAMREPPSSGKNGAENASSACAAGSCAEDPLSARADSRDRGDALSISTGSHGASRSRTVRGAPKARSESRLAGDAFDARAGSLHAGGEGDAPSDDVRSASDDDLGAETALIESARRALVAGDLGEATTTLDDYALRFPSGALAPEAEALAIETSVRQGNILEARMRAERFAREHPHSPLKRRFERLFGDPVR